MSKAIQFNKITKVKNPDSIKNGVDAGKLSCEWMEAASAPSHIKKMGIIRKVKVSDINLHDAVTQMNSGIPVDEIRHDPYLNGYSYRGKHTALGKSIKHIFLRENISDIYKYICFRWK